MPEIHFLIKNFQVFIRWEMLFEGLLHRATEIPFSHRYGTAWESTSPVADIFKKLICYRGSLRMQPKLMQRILCKALKGKAAPIKNTRCWFSLQFQSVPCSRGHHHSQPFSRDQNLWSAPETTSTISSYIFLFFYKDIYEWAPTDPQKSTLRQQLLELIAEDAFIAYLSALPFQIVNNVRRFYDHVV